MNPDDLPTWYAVLAGGGIALALGFALYFLPVRRLKGPSMLVAAAGGAGAGLAAGVLVLAGRGYKFHPPEETHLSMGEMMAQGGAPPPPPPSSRVQLVALVTALDALVDKPVALTLSPDDRAAVAAQIRGLEKPEEIGEDDAGARLTAILKVVEKDRRALEAVGYRWPSPDGKGPPKGGFGGPPKDSPSPFRQGPAAEHLKALQDRLGAK